VRPAQPARPIELAIPDICTGVAFFFWFIADLAERAERMAIRVWCRSTTEFWWQRAVGLGHFRSLECRSQTVDNVATDDPGIVKVDKN